MEKTGNKGTKRLQLATEIAKMYYLEHMTQEQIAKTIHQSRPNVSRILNQCTENGIVEIRIHDRMSTMPEVALKIKRRWNLEKCIYCLHFHQ